MVKALQVILKGIGQVMFQNNLYSGLFFLAGIFYSSWILGLAALAGTVISTLTAVVLKYSKEDIGDGLYGFNGTLTGIAILFFFEFNIITALALIIGAICSTLLMQLFRKYFPPYTSPFVLVTWIFILLLLFGFKIGLLSGPIVAGESISILSASANGFSQVMFQENLISGALFFVGILINSRKAALYAGYASILGLVCGLVLSVPITEINAGLMGYNAILCAIALISNKKSDFLWITIAVILSVLLSIGLAQTGIIILTAPFILATWIVKSITSSLPY